MHATESFKEPPATWADHVLRGRAYATVNRLDEAEEDFETAVRVAPNEPLARIERGNFYLHTKRGDKAAVDFEEVIASREKGSPTWLMSDWWTSGPYSRGLDKHDPFPRRPDAIPLTLRDLDAGGGDEFSWRHSSGHSHRFDDSSSLLKLSNSRRYSCHENKKH